MCVYMCVYIYIYVYTYIYIYIYIFGFDVGNASGIVEVGRGDASGVRDNKQ